MSNFYREVKNLYKKDLRQYNFKSDPLREGFYKNFENENSSAVFHIAGSWSYADIHYGVRHSAVNDLLYDASVKAGWPPIKSAMFKLKLMGIFREKLGDFCECDEDVGVYCPVGSTVSSPHDISIRILSCVTEMIPLSDLSVAVDYALKKKSFFPFGKYMIPAAAKIIGREDIFLWSQHNLIDQSEKDFGITKNLFSFI